MARRSDIPQFGLLSGVKVLCSAVSTAGPFAGSLFAGNGADVIWLESPYGLDALRWSNNGHGIEVERRNMRSCSLDVLKPEGAKLFERMIADVDIFIEASRGGQWTKWGYPDEKLWEINPKLVIAHMSGFGQTGLPEYVARPAYDHIMQAYSGMMALNGFPDRDPVKAERLITDYYNGLFAYGSTLAAYINALKTGKGESIDLAQYEAAVACQGDTLSLWFGEHKQQPRNGSAHQAVSASGYYTCGDGNGVYILIMGEPTLRRFMPVLGLEYGVDCDPGTVTIKKADPRGAEFERRLTAYIGSKDSETIEKEFMKMNIPCSRVMTYEMMENDPHYQARNTFVEWDNINGEHIKGRNFFPQFKNNPSQMWRPAPKYGMDSADVCRDYGFTEEEIQKMFDDGVIVTKDLVRRPM